MNLRISRLYVAAAAVALVALLAMLSGCGKQQPPQSSQTPTQSPLPTTTGKHTTVEPRDESSGEWSRTHIFDDRGDEVETIVKYRQDWSHDGGSDDIILKNHLQKSVTHTNRQGKLTSQKEYAADGQTVVGSKEFRDDGSLKSYLVTANDGTKTATAYWFDGKRVFKTEVQNPDGSFVTTFYRKSGKIWLKRTADAGGANPVSFEYNSAGVLEVRRETSTTNPDQAITTVYRPDGTVQLRQTFNVVSNNWWGFYKTLATVEQFDAAGKIARQVNLQSDGRSIDSTVTTNADGSSTYRTYRQDGAVGHEEVKDKDGKVLSSKDYLDTDHVQETLDQTMFSEPQVRDPQQSWDNQERNPSARTDDNDR